jgi:hypothetical protein
MGVSVIGARQDQGFIKGDYMRRDLANRFFERTALFPRVQADISSHDIFRFN